MSSIPQTTDNGNSVSDFATKFMQRFHLGKLLFKCNAGKEKGIPVMDVFRFLFCMMFSDRSFYMQMKTGTFGEGFSKNTIYRFLNNARTNWQRFTTLLSADIINGFGSMSILWTKKVERLCCFFEFLILLLLRCHITNCTMDSFAVIPAFYIFKDCPAGLFGILISMKIDFFLFQYRMERFDTGIVIWISLSAKGMPYLPAVQELLK